MQLYVMSTRLASDHRRDIFRTTQRLTQDWGNSHNYLRHIDTYNIYLLFDLGILFVYYDPMNQRAGKHEVHNANHQQILKKFDSPSKQRQKRAMRSFTFHSL